MDDGLFTIDPSLLTEEILHSSPGVYEPINETFAATSEEGYGEWETYDDDNNGQNNIENKKHTTEDPQNTVSDSQHEKNLATVDNIINRKNKSETFPADRRNDIVHADSDDAPREKPSWYTFKWVNFGKKSHRITGIALSTILVFAIFHIISIIPVGNKSEKNNNSAPTTAPPFTEPSQRTHAAEQSKKPTSTNKTDQPVGIKSAQSRCAAGSNNPQPIINKKNPKDGNAWRCVPAYGAPGTVLRVYFDDLYFITNICTIPGWDRINPDKSDEWLKHNTVAVIEYQFNDTEETRLEQDTKNYHGEVCTSADPPVLASAMTITIRETATPAPPKNTTPKNQQNTNKEENKDFAIGGITITGHHPQ